MNLGNDIDREKGEEPGIANYKELNLNGVSSNYPPREMQGRTRRRGEGEKGRKKNSIPKENRINCTEKKKLRPDGIRNRQETRKN